ncbi:hypothetical protein BAE44_0010829 [Dichanthelium oligosanthes]|uniref:Uncharacterized protein n=1 Tax=Dichanthelium oligosanthes TaxID=888268 RepID=A0A1E5VST7_9POAL|nr:hypothetical protein BAE44_0010829 [Dichanthelium oligosanthes]
MSISIQHCIAFVEVLCGMKHAIFLFYAAWLLVRTIFVVVFMPETKDVPLEAMRSVWAGRRFTKDAKLNNQDNGL